MRSTAQQSAEKYNFFLFFWSITMKVTIEEFVKDRHDDFCTEHSVGAVLFDQGFINSVYRETALNLNCEDGFYESSDLFKIWNKLESLPH